jgi:lysophospholipase L1-like esterase
VLLGRLGDDRLRQLGVDWQSLPKARSDAPHYFAQTGHAITVEPFWQYWSTNGLELGDRGVSERESLALWGLPLTEAREERNASGDLVLTQWFERARFEYHPNKPDPYKVLLGLLGNEIRANGGTPPVPQPTQSLAYTALGDSLATGVFAATGYVERYRAHVEADLKRPVSATNLGRNGWTSANLLNAIETNETFRTAVRDAQIISWNIGGNDLNHARSLYKSRQCGGADNQDCLRQVVATFKSNWNSIIGELLTLRNRTNTLMVTMDIYNPYVGADQASDTWADDGGQTDFQVFYPYFQDANVHIHTSASANNVPVARVALAFNGSNGSENARSKGYIAGDGLHPNDTGHEVIAKALRELSYAPLQ